MKTTTYCVCLTFNVGDLVKRKPTYILYSLTLQTYILYSLSTSFWIHIVLVSLWSLIRETFSGLLIPEKKNCPYLYWNSVVRQSLEASFLTTLPDIIENCLFILWRHLDFYFLHCIPSDEERRMLAGPTLSSSHMRRLQGTVGTLWCSKNFAALKSWIFTVWQN